MTRQIDAPCNKITLHVWIADIKNILSIKPIKVNSTHVINSEYEFINITYEINFLFGRIN
jgi:hypothetical protein